MTESHREPTPAELDHGAEGEDEDAAGSHMDAHAAVSDDDHAHVEDQLGPIDVEAWSYALLSIAAGVAVVVAFWLAVT